MDLRTYQLQAVDGFYEAVKSAVSSLIVMPTGTGKTVVMGHTVKRLPAGRVILVAHREELVFQAQAAIKRITDFDCEVEMAEFKTTTNLFGKPPRVVVASVQTLNAGRLNKFKPDDFGLLLIDEAHHATAASYRKVINHFTQNKSLKVLGVTATPDRADESALGQVFESVAFNFEISDAIKQGWLVPIEVSTVTVDGIDLSSVRTTAGDLNGAELARVMEYEKNLHEVAHPTFEIARGRRTLVFAASVAQAERLTEILNRHRSDCARFVSGETPKDDRRAIFRDYAAGKFQFLCNCGVATEGFDNPGVEVVAIARPTKSRSLYAQMIGRGTRPLAGTVDGLASSEERLAAIAASAKPRVEIIDFVGNSGTHKLVTAADILGGNYDDETIARATEKTREAGMNANALAALEESMAEIQAERERARREEAAQRQRLRVNAIYQKQKADPFDVFNISPVVERGWDKGRQISDKMRGLLEKQGINVEALNYTQAKQLVGEICDRFEKKQCSYKQAKLLQKYGLPSDVSFEQAHQWMNEISSNHWKLPGHLESMAGLEPVEIF